MYTCSHWETHPGLLVQVQVEQRTCAYALLNGLQPHLQEAGSKLWDANVSDHRKRTQSAIFHSVRLVTPTCCLVPPCDIAQTDDSVTSAERGPRKRLKQLHNMTSANQAPNPSFKECPIAYAQRIPESKSTYVHFACNPSPASTCSLTSEGTGAVSVTFGYSARTWSTERGKVTTTSNGKACLMRVRKALGGELSLHCHLR